MKAPKLTVGQYTNVTPLGGNVTSRFKPYGTPLTAPSQDTGLGLELHEPKMHSLMDTQRVLDELKRSSTRMGDCSLVTSVVQCSACSLTDDFKARIAKQMRRYPRIWQGYVRDLTDKPQVVTPLYRIAIPWVWYQSEPDRKVKIEYQMIWKQFSVMTGYPPGHHKKSKDEAVKFFNNMFGVEHLESLVGQVAFFEHLLLNEPPNDLLKSVPESRIKKLSADLINSMSGVTNEREDNWFSEVKRSVSLVQKITDSDTLALDFVVDISDTFPQKAEALNDL
ncbi:hypothetical protein EDD15DRAFT_1197973 [Pisolithus albus]|nr:hypothetical protein EDD15DRAFT_1197973 [Pisolithus albus]